MKIDSHQHFWKYTLKDFSWIDESMPAIKKDFLPDDLSPILKQNGFEGCISVQARSTEEETIFLLELSNQYPIIKGVVGWLDLCANDIEEKVGFYQNDKKLKGLRHILQDEAQRDFMLRDDFKRGLKAIAKNNWTFDLLIHPDQLEPSLKLVKEFPNQLFVIDHIAKPKIKDEEIFEWSKYMQEFSKLDNVYCKLSGLVTEVDWKNWDASEFTPYLDLIADSFGIDKIMYGSDWPVCLLAASYDQQLSIIKNYFEDYTNGEKEKIFGHNAKEFYYLYQDSIIV